MVGGVDYTEALRIVRSRQVRAHGRRSIQLRVTDFSEARSIPGPELRTGRQARTEPTLIAYVERVRAARGLGVLQFHGVGGDYLEVSAEAHQALLDHLRKHPEIWVATFQEVMDYAVARSR